MVLPPADVQIGSVAVRLRPTPNADKKCRPGAGLNQEYCLSLTAQSQAEDAEAEECESRGRGHTLRGGDD